jgi:para-aminobenzoate synthetase component I
MTLSLLQVPKHDTDSVKLLADGTVAYRLDRAPEIEHALNAFARKPNCIFFDSSMRLENLGRYSFIAADPVQWMAGSVQDFDPTVVNSDTDVDTHVFLPPFRGGWAGAWGYHLNRTIENIPAARIDEFNLPAFGMGFYDIVLAWDHQANSAWLISTGRPEKTFIDRQRRALERINQVHRWLTDSATPGRGEPEQVIAENDLLVNDRLAIDPAILTNFTKQQYLETVQRCIDYVWAGDIFQVNLSQRLLRRATGNALSLFLRLRKKNASPFGGYLDLGDHQIISSSPERFIQLENGTVKTRPIKGTSERSPDPDTDRRIAEALLHSVKDRSENTMIVDLLRNDLSRFSTDDSVSVTQLCEIETYETVHHLVSVVQSKLKPGTGFSDIFKAVFPGGSITGAPKIRAMEIIAELEPTSRGYYCGSMGYFGVDGQMDSNILIRTITASKGWWQFPVGGGIVAQSNPLDEYNETIAKAQGMIRAISPAS